jgi:hypothetical protein
VYAYFEALMEHEEKEILIRLLREAEDNSREIARVLHVVRKIERELRPQPLPSSTVFKEITMNPTIGGNTQVFTGTFVPAGSVPPSDAVYAVTSNDPAITPTVDATGLIVTGVLPVGWVESTSVPLAYTRTASSVANPTWTLSDIITPSAPPVGFPTSTTFIQTS